MKLKIEKLIYEGWGLGRADDGKAVFVKKAVPGDIVDVEITKEKKSFAEAVIKEVIEPSEDRIKPDCPFFNQCGGCEHQNITYDKQLEFKEIIFREALERQGIATDISPIIPGSKEPFFYRNSIRFFITENDQQEVVFARQNYLHDRVLTETDSCLLQSETTNSILAALKEFFNRHKVSRDLLWQIKIRQGKNIDPPIGQFMVELITTGDDLLHKEGLAAILKQITGVKSIYHTVAPGKSLLHLRRKLLWGSPVIHEKIGAFTFQISPESFFQTNSSGVKTLYDVIKDYAAIKPGEVVYDLYCGTGSIGIYLSTLAKKIIGIEVVPEAIMDAKDNTRLNHIQNCEFTCADTEKYLDDLSTLHLPPSTIIVDPPRAGLTPRTIESIANIINFPTLTLSDSHTKLIYVSCNPATFARDIALFNKHGIVLKKVQPIDMFPQTHHIECVGLLYKK